MNNESTALPRLLVSVRNAQEVLSALAGGADWIDLKEPSDGPLAAVEPRVAREAVQALAGRRTLSAALGELRDWKTGSADELLAVAGISVVKLGMAGCAGLDDWQQQWQAVGKDAAKCDKQLVAVIYADWRQADAPTPGEIIQMARINHTEYLLIDTYDKSAGTVFDHLSSSVLGKILHEAKQLGMTTVLAGSLTQDSLDQVPSKFVDMVAVRGAVCRGDRTAGVDAELVAGFRRALATKFA